MSVFFDTDSDVGQFYKVKLPDDSDAEADEVARENDAFFTTQNMFCPTGPGGGVDPTCGKGEGGKTKAELELVSKAAYRTWQKSKINGTKAEQNRAEEAYNKAFKAYQDASKAKPADTGTAKAAVEKFNAALPKVDENYGADTNAIIDQKVTAMKEMASRTNYSDAEVKAAVANGFHDFNQNTDAESIAANIIDRWAETSGTDNPQAVALQLAAAERFNMQDFEAAHFGNATYDTVADARKLLDKPDLRPMLYKTLDAMYSATQDKFKELGITELTVMRGESIAPDALQSGVVASELKLQPLSSFTTDYSKAEMFASKSGRIHAVKVPVDRILTTPLTGMGCSSESEVIIMAGKYKAVTGSNKSGAYPKRDALFAKLTVNAEAVYSPDAIAPDWIKAGGRDVKVPGGADSD